jgi:tripartite-type tricarboxylate transporter receptor subunit TctC
LNHPLITRRGANALALAWLAGAALPSHAAAYPDRPVKIVLGFAPGGATDGLARVLARKLGERMGQQFVVDNKPGAATRIGMEFMQKAPPDGYTLGLATAVTTTFPLMFENLAFAPGKDFVAISMLGRAPTFLMVRHDLPAKDYAEFVALGKKTGQLTLGHPGNGSNPHIAGLALARAAGMPVVAVPYKGTQPTATAVGAGEVDFAMMEYAVARPMLEAGKVRLLAVTEPARSRIRPEVPTGREAGITQDIEGLTPWFMLLAPAGTPPAVVDALNRQVREALADKEVREQLANLGVEPESSTPGEASAYFTAQRQRIARLAAELQLSLKS